MDPDDMSAASDDDPSVLGGEDEEEANVQAMSDEEDEDACNEDDDEEEAEEAEEAEENGDSQVAADKDNQDDGNDEDDDGLVPQPDSDEEDVPQQKPTKQGATGIMKHFQLKQAAAAAASIEKVTGKPGPSKAAEPSKSSKSSKPTAAVSRPKGGKGGKAAAAAAAEEAPPPPVAIGKSASGKNTKAKGQKPKEAASAKKPKEAAVLGVRVAVPQDEFSFRDSEDDEVDEVDELDSMTLPKNKGAPMVAPDAEMEFEEIAKNGGTNARGTADETSFEETPSVSDSAKKRRYVIKNAKTKRWGEWLANGLRYAPECSDLFEFTIDDLTIASKKERMAAQGKLADAQMPKIISTLIIGELTMDAAGSGSGPGMKNLMCAIPSKVPLYDNELQCLLARMNRGEEDDDTEIVALHVLDPDVVKRVFKVHRSQLPTVYNPISNSTNKYKLIPQVEKLTDFDCNFLDLGLIEKPKQRAPKRAAGSEPASSKADGKRSANGTAPSAATCDPASKEGVLNICGEPTLLKGFANKEFATSYAELHCKPDQQFTMLPAGQGKFLLILGPIARA